MKDIYVLIAFHAHELLWDLPRIMLSYLDDENPMKGGILDENYLRMRQQEERDIYSQCLEFSDRLNIPVCLEFSNELLSQLAVIMPNSFKRLVEGYKSKKIYPIYGHAHHAHVSLLTIEELTQEIQWNMQFLHNYMGIPYPKYNGLFSTEASYSFHKMEGVENANIHYVIFPHLSRDKSLFNVSGEGDIKYEPFFIKTDSKNILALPRNFPISQEIWRPITKMRPEEVKFQGYILGKYPVFKNEYLNEENESYPINIKEGVEMYKEIVLQELKEAPHNGLLVYIQDLELMDFGDAALEILEHAWKEVVEEAKGNCRIHFVTPDDYIDKVLKKKDMSRLPSLSFKDTTWAPEIRLVLRTDGHYPPLGVENNEKYSKEKTGLYDRPHIFWENGKYYCKIFDTLVDNFGVSSSIPVHPEYLAKINYDLCLENLDVQTIMFLRIMKRACNWGWRPTEGRQKLPYLKGYLLCDVLLHKFDNFPLQMILNKQFKKIKENNIVGIAEIIKILIDKRISYLRYGFNSILERGEFVDFISVENEVSNAEWWRKRAQEKAVELYEVNQGDIQHEEKIRKSIVIIKDYSLAVYIATDYLQKVWGLVPDTELMVEKMYEYLYELYPPIFPSMLDKIDNMSSIDVKNYFAALKEKVFAEPEVTQ